MKLVKDQTRPGVVFAPFHRRMTYGKAKRRAGTRHGWLAPCYGRPERSRKAGSSAPVTVEALLARLR